MTMHKQHRVVADELVGACWKKSSYSGSGEGQCVEVADLSATAYRKIAVRDSKRPAGSALMLSTSAYSKFITATAAS